MDVVEEQLDSNNSTNDDSKNSESAKALDIGALLIEARENKQLTSQDIAKQMNLTLSVITKIESNQFAQDIPLAFIRGYIRSYAQKVGLDVENICVEFDRQTQQLNEPLQSIKVVSSFKASRREMNSSSFVFKFITFLIIAALLAFGGWEVWKRLNKPSSETTLSVNEINLSTQNSDTENSLIPLEEHTVAGMNTPVEKVAPDKQIDDMVEFSQASAVGEQLQNGDETINDRDVEVGSAQISEEAFVSDSKVKKTEPVVSMNFQFSSDCWVKVTDANDEVLAIGIKKMGKVMPLEGVAPISVILGEPSAVSIEYQGKAYALDGFRAGETAKFVLE